jgi:hypothetical protein
VTGAPIKKLVSIRRTRNSENAERELLRMAISFLKWLMNKWKLEGL